MSNVSGIIKSIQDIMRKDVGVDGDAQRIGQLVWMLFLKIFDDREQEAELLQNEYRSPIPKKLRWRNWAADPEGMTGVADGLVVDFGTNGVWKYDGSSWSRLSNWNPENMDNVDLN